MTPREVVAAVREILRRAEADRDAADDAFLRTPAAVDPMPATRGELVAIAAYSAAENAAEEVSDG